MPFSEKFLHFFALECLNKKDSFKWDKCTILQCFKMTEQHFCNFGSSLLLKLLHLEIEKSEIIENISNEKLFFL